uniref:Leucine rich repeat containing 71 n=1 Tax=Phasianus colchicus TaxID=9054 RepID=A0A669QKE4_PHACC
SRKEPGGSGARPWKPRGGAGSGASTAQRRIEKQYQCCGLLQQDLTELCAWAGITSIPRVTVRPSSAAGEELGAAGGAGRKRFDSSDTASPTAEGAEPCRLGERCIQVELQNDSDPRSVCGVFLRGWKVEEEMLGVLSKCLPALANLKVLNLGAVLPHRSLTLEGNPLPEHSFHVLMGASSTLSHLSLRNNCIDDRAAQLLGQGLSSMSSSNHSLLSLVLSFNRISDVGAEHIAEGLRWNRSLLSLSLAHNRIGDVGAVKLAEVLQPFKLRHEEVVERRRLLMEEQGQPHAESSSGHALSLQGSAAAGKLSPAKQRTGTTKKKVKRQAASMGSNMGSLGTPAGGVWGEQCSGTWGGERGGGGTLVWILRTQCPQAGDPAEPRHPLLEPGLHRDGNVILPGNRVLLNLNLSRECGAGGGLAAARPRPHARILPPQTTGSRSEAWRNSFSSACAAFTRLQELLLQRDPLPKPAEDEEERSQDP